MSDLIERVTREFERDQARALRPVAVGEVPVSYASITDEWLTHALCRDHADARVVAHRCIDVDDGNTNRARLLLTYNDAGLAAGLPPTAFCKATQQLHVRLFLATSGLIVGEELFYRKLRPLLDVDTPHCLFAAYDPQSYNSIFIFDDLARQGAMFCEHTTEITRRRAESQMAYLARLHGRLYDSPAMAESGVWTYEEMFARLDGYLKLEGYSGKGFEEAIEVIPDRLHGRHDGIWKAVLASNQLHARHPRTLTHNDVHLRNWYLDAADHMVLGDWQCIAAGHWARDVAYAMTTSLTTANRRMWEQELLALYLDRFHEAGGPRIGVDDAWTFYRQHLCSSLIWWTSTLAMAYAQPRDALLELIGRMAAATDDLDALQSFDGT